MQSFQVEDDESLVVSKILQMRPVCLTWNAWQGRTPPSVKPNVLCKRDWLYRCSGQEKAACTHSWGIFSCFTAAGRCTKAATVVWNRCLEQAWLKWEEEEGMKENQYIREAPPFPFLTDLCPSQTLYPGWSDLI